MRGQIQQEELMKTTEVRDEKIGLSYPIYATYSECETFSLILLIEGCIECGQCRKGKMDESSSH